MNQELLNLVKESRKGVKVTSLRFMRDFIPNLYGRTIDCSEGEENTYNYEHKIDFKKVYNYLKQRDLGVRVLDIGCGIGYALNNFHEMGAETWGTSKHIFKESPKEIKDNIIFGTLDNSVPKHYESIPKNYFNLIVSTNGDINYGIELKSVDAIRKKSDINKPIPKRIAENNEWLDTVLEWIDSVSTGRDAFVSLQTLSFDNTFKDNKETLEIIKQHGFNLHRKIRYQGNGAKEKYSTIIGRNYKILG